MKTCLSFLLALFVLAPAAWAQTAVQEPSVQQAKYESVFELVRLVNALWQLEQRPDSRFEASEAASALVILVPLADKAVVTPGEANQAFAALEALMNPRQQFWWAELRAAQERILKRRLPTIRTVGKPTPYAFFLPGYFKLWDLALRGEAFNPFKLEPNGETLSKLISALEERAGT